MSGDGQRPWQFQENSRRLFPKWAISVRKAHVLSEFIEAERVFWLGWISQWRILKLSLSTWKKRRRNIVSSCLPNGNRIFFKSIYLSTYLSLYCGDWTQAFPMLGQHCTREPHHQQCLFAYNYYHLHIAQTVLIFSVLLRKSWASHSITCLHLPGTEKIVLSPCPAGFAILICSYVSWDRVSVRSSGWPCICQCFVSVSLSARFTDVFDHACHWTDF